jgi:hypothetical protein
MFCGRLQMQKTKTTAISFPPEILLGFYSPAPQINPAVPRQPSRRVSKGSDEPTVLEAQNNGPRASGPAGPAVCFVFQSPDNPLEANKWGRSRGWKRLSVARALVSPRPPKNMAPRCLYSICTRALTTAARYRVQAEMPR